MIDTTGPSVSVASEKVLRRQIDRSVSRALVDEEYARILLANPTVVLEEHGCPPQQYRTLRGIRASSLIEFARQAHALFWAAEPAHAAAHSALGASLNRNLRAPQSEAAQPLAAAAAL
jgi:hypothetical protein